MKNKSILQTEVSASELSILKILDRLQVKGSLLRTKKGKFATESGGGENPETSSLREKTIGPIHFETRNFVPLAPNKNKQVGLESLGMPVGRGPAPPSSQRKFISGGRGVPESMINFNGESSTSPPEDRRPQSIFGRRGTAFSPATPSAPSGNSFAREANLQ
jgi:hypothetical protein